MSTCIEQLLPILSLEVRDNMPFSTPVSPDKRIIDFLFGKNPMKLDENFIRFFLPGMNGRKADIWNRMKSMVLHILKHCAML